MGTAERYAKLVEKSQLEPAYNIQKEAMKNIFGSDVQLVDNSNLTTGGINLQVVKLDDLDGTLAIAVNGMTFKMDDPASLVKAVLTYTGVDVNSKAGRKAIKEM